MTRTWKEDLYRLANDFYRGADMPLALDEMYHGIARKHRGEAPYSEMAKHFKRCLADAKDFYSDTKTVAALMACSH